MADIRRTSRPSSLSDDLTGSDFLFHLYRGAEMLQENQVHEAKAEIENALKLQPREPQGQDLLAQVYFRLGLYPRSIAIYENLADAFPEEVTPRINLALCYLKTGQPERAREQLERVVSAEPARQRAWGYLGLAFERLGDYQKAYAAFNRAGYVSMARRMESLFEDPAAIPVAPASMPEEPGPDLTELRSVAEAAFHELDVTDDAFSLALPSENTSKDSGTWFAVELGQAIAKTSKPLPVSPKRDTPQPAPPRVENSRIQSSVPAAKSVNEFARESTLVFPRDCRAAKHVGGSMLLATPADFAVRMDLVRVFSTHSPFAASTLLPRLHGGDPSIPLGGSTRPLSIVENSHRLVLGPRHSFVLHSIELRNEGIFVREDCLAGFDATLAYDHGRLASGYGDAITLIHIHGEGLVVLELPSGFAAFENWGNEGCVIRGSSLLGWVGRVVGRCLPATDAPGDVRGWTAFSGDGTVLFDPNQEPF